MVQTIKINAGNIIGDNYWKVSKILAWHFSEGDLGILSSMLVADFLSKRDYLNKKGFLNDDLSFYYEQSDIEKFTLISPYKQGKCLELLKNYNLITTYKKGIPHKIFYIINDEAIINIIRDFDSTQIPQHWE